MTTHELARKLLAFPDVPVFHFDPSLVVYETGDPEDPSESLTEPKISLNEADGEAILAPFVMIAGSNEIEEDVDIDWDETP